VSCQQVPVEGSMELERIVVVDVPKCRDDRASTGDEQGRNQPADFCVSVRIEPSGFTSAEHENRTGTCV
jgi:hypothetical protein